MLQPEQVEIHKETSLLHIIAQVNLHPLLPLFQILLVVSSILLLWETIISWICNSIIHLRQKTSWKSTKSSGMLKPDTNKWLKGYRKKLRSRKTCNLSVKNIWFRKRMRLLIGPWGCLKWRTLYKTKRKLLKSTTPSKKNRKSWIILVRRASSQKYTKTFYKFQTRNRRKSISKKYRDWTKNN